MKTRRAIVRAALALIFTYITGCSITPLSAQHKKDEELISLQRAELERQRQQLEAQATTITALNDELAQLKIGPPKPLQRFSLYTGRAQGQQRFDVIWVLEHSSSRMVAIMFNSTSDKMEVIAGRELSKDLAGPNLARRDPVELLTPDFTQGSSVITVRTSDLEDCMIAVDNANYRLLVYKVSLPKKRIEFVGFEDLIKLFNLKEEKQLTAPSLPSPLVP